MNALFRLHLQHILRTKLLLFVLVVSFLVQLAGLKMVSFLQVQFDGQAVAMNEVGPRVYVLMMLQLFNGSLLSYVYGIWVVPYLHHGERATLTFTLPFSRWVYAAVYAVSLLVLLLFQFVVMFLTYSLIFGSGGFIDFPWGGLLMCLLWQVVVFECALFALSMSSIILGKVLTFLLMGIGFFMLTILGLFFKGMSGRWEEGAPTGIANIIYQIYRVLPPVGEVLMDLGHQISTPDMGAMNNFWLWLVWTAVFVVGFEFILRYPLRSKGAE